MSELVGSFKAVLFCPEHLSLIKDGPAERRQFLDIAISGLEPAYLFALQRYNRILKQRNALIKEAEKNPADFKETVAIWSSQLAKEGAYIAKSRERYVKRLSFYVEECFADMTGSKEKPGLFYHGCGGKDFNEYEDVQKTEEALYRRLCENHEREIGAGATLYGIHKDDIEVYLNERTARIYCSQGQQRSLALALKIAEAELIKEDFGEYPVLLFDDVLSELDGGRRAYLLGKIKGKQVILTTCEKEEFLSAHRIFVKGGTYCAEEA
jgi:DNA replication and repair protein RecF